jgi:hypothetical protein
MKALKIAVAALALSVLAVPAAAFADGCYTCGSGSQNGCKECRYGDSKNETFAARRACENAGCKVSGTTSCSTASNVKVCSPK